MTIIFVANRPGAWLREDIGNVLTALTIRHDNPEYLDALRAAAQALGLDEVPGTVAQHYGATRAIVEVLP